MIGFNKRYTEKNFQQEMNEREDSDYINQNSDYINQNSDYQN